MRGNGTETSPYLIGSVEEWNEIAVLKQTNTWVEIDNDIDFKDKVFKSLWLISSTTSSGGHFLGNNHTIKNIEVNGTTDGLIVTATASNTNYAEIRDVTFENVNVTITRTSEIVLLGNSGTIKNVKVKGLNISSAGNVTVFRASSNPLAEGIVKCMVQGYIQAPSVSLMYASFTSVIQSYTECDIYLTSNTASYGMRRYNTGDVLMSFCKNHWYNGTGIIYDFSFGNAVQCYSASQYTNCTGNIYPCTTSKVACFYNSDFTQGLTVVESGCVAITTEQMKNRQTFEEKGWVFTDVD